jgi:hypothetical protein
MKNLKYITFDQLMASVESDFDSYADAGMINRGKVIDIIRAVNADLGLKLNQEKQTILEIKNYKADLPEDFMYLQLALGCTVEHYNLGPGSVLGTHTVEHNSNSPISSQDYEIPVNVYQNNNEWAKCQLNECGGTYWVTQQFKNKTIKFDRLIPLKLTKRSDRFCSDNCLNRFVNNAGYDIDIQHGQIVTGFREGKIYINYLADMIDEEGNILVYDHPLLTQYYAYSAKERLMENFYMNGDIDAERRLARLDAKLQSSRLRALNFINTIEYTEIQDFYKTNRTRFYNQYISIFDTHERGSFF